MGIYTKAGDDGFTARLSGRRVRKSDPLVAAGGSVDELAAHVGLCLQRALADGVSEAAEALQAVRAELLSVGALLAAAPHADETAPDEADPPAAAGLDAALTRMERRIDRLSEPLPPLDQLLLPGGTELACRLHVARTVCRRAERDLAAADATAAVPDIAAAYLNRLSDLLFVLARLANRAAGREEEPWRP